MAFSRRLGVVSILGACWFVAVGCGDDEDRKTGTEDGGEGGEGTGTSGSGGKTSIAGSQNNAGNAGKGGTGGSAGSANNAGEGGSGGDAGSGGIVAGAGGVGAGGEAGAPGGGAAGAGGEGGAPEPVAAMCKYQCDGNEDCTFVDAAPHKCDLTTGSCARCVADADCMVELINWATTCQNVSECDFPDTQACVDWQGVGYCADLPDVSYPEFPCLFGGRPQMVPLFGAQGDIEVCAADARCFAGACEFGCTDPLGECGNGNGDTCNPTTGRCECELGTECNAGTGVCGTDSLCAECVTPQDCPGGNTGRDACVNGKCGCAGVNSCPNRNYVGGNTPKVCE